MIQDYSIKRFFQYVFKVCVMKRLFHHRQYFFRLYSFAKIRRKKNFPTSYFLFIYDINYIKVKLTVKPAITIDTMLINLMRILSDGPDVSLKGSPTVSPTTVALC